MLRSNNPPRRRAAAKRRVSDVPRKRLRARGDEARVVDLERRAQPVQQRAQETVELILDTAARLLEEVGADGLTTKLLADRASVRVRSVYRYFPNKLAIIRALAERVAERQKVVLQIATRRSDDQTPWRVALRRELDALVETFQSQPGLAPIRRAMQASPALREVDTRANEEVARLWAEDLRSRGPRGNRTDWLRVARTAVQLSVALLDPIEREPGIDDAARLRELMLALESYLANYLDPTRKET